MSLYIKSPTEIITNLGIQSNGPAHAYFTERCRDHMDEYVPYSDDAKSTIHLREAVTTTTNSITYNVPYAHYMYIGKLYVMDNGKGAYYSPDYGFWSEKGVAKHPTETPLNYHTPGTGPYWDIQMATAEGNEVVKEVQEYVKIHGGK